MQFLFIAFMISVPLIPIEVWDFPYSDDPVYLVYEETESGFMISLSSDFEGNISAMMEYIAAVKLVVVLPSLMTAQGTISLLR